MQNSKKKTCNFPDFNSGQLKQNIGSQLLESNSFHIDIDSPSV